VGLVRGHVQAIGGPPLLRPTQSPTRPVGTGPNLKIIVRDLSGGLVAVAKTNDKGDYSVALVPGNYRVLGGACGQTHVIHVDAGVDQTLDFICQMR